MRSRGWVVFAFGALLPLLLFLVMRGGDRSAPRAPRSHEGVLPPVEPDAGTGEAPRGKREAADGREEKAPGTAPQVQVPPITGTVRDSAGPLPGAQVYALAESKVKATAVADQAGRFSLEVAKVRRYDIEATASGHTPTALRALWTGGGCQAEPGDNVDITLAPGFAMGGRVVDQAGIGLAGATIRSHSLYLKLKRRSLLYFVGAPSDAVARTDALGRFSLAEVPARGRTGFRVTLEGYQTGSLTVQADADPPVREYLVRLAALPVLAGTVFSEDGRPLAGIMAMRTGQPIKGDVGTGDAVSTGDDGTFRIYWTKGARALLVWGLGHPPAIREVRPSDLALGSTMEIRLRRAGEIRGLVRDDEGRPVVGARLRTHHYTMEVDGRRGHLYAPFVRSYEPDPEAWVLLTMSAAKRLSVAEARTGADGRFRLRAGGRGDTETVLFADKEGYVATRSTWKDGTQELLVKLTRAARVTLTAADAETSIRLGEFRVTAKHATAPMVSRANTARGAPVEFFVAPGRVTLTVESEGYGKETLSLDLQPGEELSRDLVLRRR